jgi:hypothetical protein
MARACPTRRGNIHDPPLSGISPIAEKLWMNFAERAATTMSHASAILAPAPAATPLTCAITGCGMDVSAVISGFQPVSTVVPRSTGMSPAATERSLRSCPAQKARPAPVRIRTRASAASASAERSSWCICAVKLLSRSGRLSVIRATWSSSLNSMVS